MNELPPELFYQQAQLFDAAAARFETALSDFRRESRQIGEYWDGLISEAFEEVSQELSGWITKTAQPIPSVAQALRQAGDALALAQQRIRDLQAHQAQQAAAPPPATAPPPGTPTPEQLDHDAAVQILRDLGTAYQDIGLGIAPMDDAGGKDTKSGDNGPGTGDGGNGDGNNVVRTDYKLTDDGLNAPYPVGTGIFGATGFGPGSGGVFGAGRFFASGGSATEAAYTTENGPLGLTGQQSGTGSQHSVVTPTDAPRTFSAFALAPQTEEAVVPAVLGRTATTVPAEETAVSTKSKKSTKKKAAEETEEGTFTAETERPITVSEATVENTDTPAETPLVTVSHTPVHVTTPATVTTQATTQITAAATAGTPQTPVTPGTPQVPGGTGHQVTVNAATAERVVQTGGGLGGATTGGYSTPSVTNVAHTTSPSPVRPLTNLTAATEAGFPMTTGGGGAAAPGATAGAGSTTHPMSPMMMGGMRGQNQQENERMADVPIGPGPDVWDRGMGAPSVLGRPQSRQQQSQAAEPSGANADRLAELQQLLGDDDVLGRIRERRGDG